MIGRVRAGRGPIWVVRSTWQAWRDRFSPMDAPGVVLRIAAHGIEAARSIVWCCAKVPEPRAIPSLAALEEQDVGVEVEVNTTVPNTNTSDKAEAAEALLSALAAEAEEEQEDGG